VQLTSDGLRSYIEAVESAFGSEIDYGQLVKLYGNETPQMETRYSPPPCIGARKTRIVGNPDPAHCLNVVHRTAKPHRQHELPTHDEID